MPWNLDSDKPIFLQIVERLEQDILSGSYAPGEKIPSVRDLALEAAVNPNTMQKALAELERKGLVYSQRTSGRFVTEDNKLIARCKAEKAQEDIRLFMADMNALGLTKEEVITLIQKL